MPRCFVIQPFDKGKYDKRFRDVFEPAITAAGLEPYRVDRDPGVSIPIDEIEKGLRDAPVCFAEITTDNPNVWFELGFAIAEGKDICMICSDERKTPFPFDVQHRSIIKYAIESPSDFGMLSNSISERLSYIMNKNEKLQIIQSSSPIKETEGLSDYEIITLCTIMENKTGPNAKVCTWEIAKDMDRLGYNRLAVNLGLQKLIKKQLIVSEIGHDRDDEEVEAFRVSELGLRWLLENEDKLNLKRPKRTMEGLDDEVPF